MRFYSPELGRWVSRDPIGEQGGFNVYAHTKNVPLNKIDPHGELGLWTGFMIGTAVYIAAEQAYLIFQEKATHTAQRISLKHLARMYAANGKKQARSKQHYFATKASGCHFAGSVRSFTRQQFGGDVCAGMGA
ncbi:MAG: RHS repeat-associated core domain-containing protein [Lentisphaeria bacterium]